MILSYLLAHPLVIVIGAGLIIAWLAQGDGDYHRMPKEPKFQGIDNSDILRQRLAELKRKG